MKWFDYRFGPKERSGYLGRIGEPMFSVRQIFMLPTALIFGLSLVVAAPILARPEPADHARSWEAPFIWAAAFLGATAYALGDLIDGMRPRWDFRDQCWLRGLRIKR